MEGGADQIDSTTANQANAEEEINMNAKVTLQSSDL